MGGPLFGAASDEYRSAAEFDPEGIMGGTLLFAAVRTACEAADDPQFVDPTKLFMYEHGYLAPPIE